MNSKSEDINEENAFAHSSKNILTDLKFIQNSSDNSTVGVSTKDSSTSNRSQNSSPVKRKRDSLQNYIQHDVIGFGSYGKVIKVQEKKGEACFAMKAINKSEIEKVSIYCIFHKHYILI